MDYNLPSFGCVVGTLMVLKNTFHRLGITNTPWVTDEATWTKLLIERPLDKSHQFQRWILPGPCHTVHEYYTPQWVKKHEKWNWTQVVQPRYHIYVKIFEEGVTRPNRSVSLFLGLEQENIRWFRGPIYEFKSVTGRLYVSNHLEWLKAQRFPIMKWGLITLGCLALLNEK